MQIRVPKALGCSLSGRFYRCVHPNQMLEEAYHFMRAVYMVERTKVTSLCCLYLVAEYFADIQFVQFTGERLQARKVRGQRHCLD